MATLQDYRNERIKKLEQLKVLGINPYPASSERTNYNSEIELKFSELEGSNVSVVGRIKNIRKMGKIGFIVIEDQTGRLQLFLSEDSLSSADRANSELKFSEVNLLDTGDFIQASGEVIKTKTGVYRIKSPPYSAPHQQRQRC